MEGKQLQINRFISLPLAALLLGQTLLIHLVELYINAVIYHRHIYPDPCFQRRRAFSAFGYVSVFPPLHVYIRRILERAVQLIKDKTLYVVEVVFEANNEEVESHELKIKQLNLSEIDGEIEERMKEFLLQLDTKFRALKALPKNPTVKINLITTNGSLQKINEDLEFQVRDYFEFRSHGNDILFSRSSCGSETLILPSSTRICCTDHFVRMIIWV